MSQAGITDLKSASPTLLSKITTDAGVAIPVANNINLLGGNNVSTSAAAESITIDLTGTTEHALQIGNASGSLTSLTVGASGEVLIGNTGADASFSSTPTVTTMYATTFDTNIAAAGLTLSGTILAADGTDANINITILPKGTSSVIMSSVDIASGEIDAVTLGTNSAVTEAQIDNININLNTIQATTGTLYLGSVTADDVTINAPAGKDIDIGSTGVPEVNIASGTSAAGNTTRETRLGKASYTGTATAADSISIGCTILSTSVSAKTLNLGGGLSGAAHSSTINIGELILDDGSSGLIQINSHGIISGSRTTTIGSTAADCTTEVKGGVLELTGLIDINSTLGDLILDAKASSAVVVNAASIDVDFQVNGDTIDNLLFVDAGNDKVGIGTNAIPVNAVGTAFLAVDDAQPFIQMTRSTIDDYPLITIDPFTHDDLSITFDAYYQTGWKSSDVGSNFAISKVSDKFEIRYESGNALGAAVGWNKALIIDTAGTATFANTVYGTTFDTNVAAAGVTLAGTSLICDGTDADIDLTLTAKGTGSVVMSPSVGVGTNDPISQFEVASIAGAGEQLATFSGGGDVSVQIIGESATPAAGELYFEITPATSADSWKLGTNDAMPFNISYGVKGTMNTQEKMTVTTAGEITMPKQPAVLAYNSADDVNQTGNGTAATVDLDTEVYDQNADFAGDTFTSPVTGKCRAEAQVMCSALNGATTSTLTLVTSNRSYILNTGNPTNGANAAGEYSQGGSVLADMDAADTATVTLTNSGAGADNNTINGSASPYETFVSIQLEV